MNSSTTTVSPTTLRARKTAQTIGYYAGFAALGVVSASLGPTLPNLAENTSSALSQISYVFTAHSLGYLIGSSQGGRLYDRMPGHPVLASVLLIVAALIVGVPFVTHLWLLAAVWLLIGAAAGVLDVGGNTLLVWVHQDQVGPYMNGLHFFFGVGAFLSPLIVAQVMQRTDNVRWVYWTLALLVVPVILLISRLPSPSVQNAGQEKANSQVNILLVILLALFFFLIVGAELGIGGWIFTYALKMNLGDETTAAYLNSAFWGAFTLGRLLAIPIAIRLRPRTMLAGNLILGVLSACIILIWPHSPPAVWIGVMGAGLTIAPLFATTMSLAESLMSITGQATGWFFIGVSSGGLIIPWLIGQLFERIGPQVITYTTIANLGLALIIFVALMTLFGDKRQQFETN